MKFASSILLLFLLVQQAQGQARGRAANAPEQVSGRGCYTYGDDETPRKARSAALAIAEEEAIRSYHVFVQSSTTVKLSQLEDDVVAAASVGLLRNEKPEDEPVNGRTFCVRITATVDPAEMSALIQQRVKASQIAQSAASSVINTPSAFGLKVWTDKAGTYLEGDPLTVSVQSERDVYLKLDYFQADGTVVHLVPNVYGGDAFIRAGRVYNFGGTGGAEKFVVSAPFGNEAIKAIASTKPFEGAIASRSVSEDSTTYLRGLQGAMRGIKATGTDSDSRWAEVSVEVVTVGKAAAEHKTAKKR